MFIYLIQLKRNRQKSIFFSRKSLTFSVFLELFSILTIIGKMGLTLYHFFPKVV